MKKKNTTQQTRNSPNIGDKTRKTFARRVNITNVCAWWTSCACFWNIFCDKHEQRIYIHKTNDNENDLRHKPFGIVQKSRHYIYFNFSTNRGPFPEVNSFQIIHQLYVFLFKTIFLTERDDTEDARNSARAMCTGNACLVYLLSWSAKPRLKRRSAVRFMLYFGAARRPNIIGYIYISTSTIHTYIPMREYVYRDRETTNHN